MLTVKHLQDDGSEVTFQAERVIYVPLNIKAPTPQFMCDQVFCYEKDGADTSNPPLVGGKVYVMNESGKTVANYVMCTAPEIDFAGVAKRNSGQLESAKKTKI